jgi:HlyD family secretion protein
VVLDDRADALKVPIGALFRHDSVWAVFVAAEGRARLRTVEIGLRNDVEAEVVNGLREGERIVLYPPDTLTDGARIIERTSA